MSDTIEPALSAEEWTDVADGYLSLGRRHDEPDSILFALDLRNDGDVEIVNDSGDHQFHFAIKPDRIPRVVAFLNAALRDGDPRKITRDWIEELRGLAEEYDLPEKSRALCAKMSVALESYLPPV